MLTLTRKEGEVLTIGDNVEITIFFARGGRARIGIAAPKNIPVHRKEIYLKVKGAQNGTITNLSS